VHYIYVIFRIIPDNFLMNKYTINNLPKKIELTGSFDDSCEFNIGQHSLDAIEHGKLQVRIRKISQKQVISRLKISIECFSGNIIIYVANDGARVDFAEGTRGQYDLRLWRNSKVFIGKKTTSNGIKIVCDNSEFICGEDCMFSDGTLVQTADQHGIVDIKSGLIINDIYKSVYLADHVWLGRMCTLTANARVGEGTVIGTGAIVTGKIPGKAIAVGVPAKVIKENHTWSRSPIFLDAYSKNYIGES